MVARSCDPLDGSGEPAAGTHSVVAPANHKTKMNKRLSVVKGHFPKLADCAHFHYDNVDFGSSGIQLQYCSDQSETNWTSSAKDIVFMVQVTCQGKSWMVRRSYEEFSTLDAHLHQCIYDRRYSQLAALPTLAQIGDRTEILCPLLSEYLSRLSIILDDKLNCGPVLTWMEIDNRGNRFLLKEEASLNVPAIAAAHVIKRYTAQASDEISIEVGDILSVIDMPPREETSWWRGKQGFQVGFFPSECVELINSEQPHSVESASSGKTDTDQVSSKPTGTGSPGPASPTSVHKKHGKLLGFLRTFIKSRPSKQKLKQRGILKERVFGCDLGEHLLNSGLEVPQVLISCSEFIEQHGVVDGIYRHSGVSSNIQRLRHEFDSEMLPDLTKEVYIQDIHCVGSLCKLYFRELPNPLLTYQLYDKFADCMGDLTDDERMAKVHDVIQQLPPPHYRTLEYLIRHLARLATCSGETNMHIKNLAIVWAPNLLRSKEIETAGLVGSDPFREVRVQSVVVEFLLSHVDVLFSDSFTSVGKFTQGQQPFQARPKSFVSTRLLSLEEAQARTQAPLLLQGAPTAPIQQGQYHTVLDAQDNRRKRGLKERKTAGSWKTFFAIGKSTRKPMRISSLFQPTMSNAGCHVDSVTLRSAKSEESLSSQHSGPAPGEVQRLRRPRSSSDGLSLAAAMETHHLHSAQQRPPSRLPSSRSYDSLLPGEQRHDNRDQEEDDVDGDVEDDDEDEDGDGVYMMPDFSNQEPASSWMAEDVIDFSPTFLEDGPIGLGSSRDSPPTGSPPAYHCLNHQVQRPITEDPDSVLNQSEAVARRSLIIAATAPPQQVFCQHRPSNSSPEQGEAANQNASQITFQAPERRSFTKKMVHALSSKPPPKAPTMDISQPIAISVPAKVLEMIGGRAGETQQPPPPGGSAPPPQMISMLLRSCDFQLSDSCQQELHSKLGTAVPGAGKGIPGPTGAPLPPQQPPPPPPKNPARLMALVLAESANRALRHQGSSPPYHPPTANSKADREPLHQLSDAPELLSNESTVYSSVVQRPLSAWMNNNSADGAPPGQATRTHTQDTGTLSSETSVSDSAATDQSGGSSSGDEHTPSPVYTNQGHGSRRSPSDSRPARRKPPAYGRQLSAPHLHQKSTTTASSPASAVTTVSASVSTQNISLALQQPQLQHSQHSQSQSMAYPQPSSQTHMHHSRSESSPLSQAIAHQPGRPKVPPKPLDLVAPQRDREPPPSQRSRDLALQVAPPGPTRDHQHPLSRSELRRSLDADRVRRLVGEQGVQPPLARAFSERLSGAPDRLARYHAARAASQPVPACPPPPAMAPGSHPGSAHHMSSSCPADDQGKVENFYYEIGAPRGDGPLPLQPHTHHHPHPHPSPSGPPSYARHAYLNMRPEDFLCDRPGSSRPLSRGGGGGGGGPAYHHHGGYPGGADGGGGRRTGPMWSSDATRAWAASQSLRCHDNNSSTRPRLQRQPAASQSVRLPPARSEMHPLAANASFSTPLTPAPTPAPAPAAAGPPQAHPAPLHPYFQNGRVYYRSQPDEAPPQQHGDHHHRPEPVYVNYPFTTTTTTSSAASSLPPPPPYVSSASSSAPVSRGWATSDLDPPQPPLPPPSLPPLQPPSPLLSPLLLTPPDQEDQRDSPSPSSSSSSPSPASLSPSPVAPEPTTPEHGGGGRHHHHHPGTDGGTDERERREDGGSGGGAMDGGGGWRSGDKSPPAGAQGRDATPPPPPPQAVMSGQDIAALLMEKMTQEEREDMRSSRAPPDTSPSPPHAPHPPNPYAPAPPPQPAPPPPPYHHSAAQRGEQWWRAASAGGQRYRQVFDVLPSGDQVLRFHRSEEEAAAAAEHNPFPIRPGYQEPPYPHHRSSYPSHQLPAPFGGSRGGNYPPPSAQSQPPQHTSHYPPPQPLYPPRREMIPDPRAMRGQRGLVRQGSLPGAPWSQTRSYC